MFEGAVFKSNRNQAIRLPQALALPEEVKRVEIVAVGHTRIISPVGKSWDSWFEGPIASSDFMEEREQPEMQERDIF